MDKADCSSWCSSSTLALQYDVLCLRKQQTAPINKGSQSSTLNYVSSSTPLSYNDVVDELDSERWPFDPYPRCNRSQLSQVHVYWVVVPKRDTAESTSPSYKGVDTISPTEEFAKPDQETAESPKESAALNRRSEAKPMPKFCCVVGVVWVRFSGTVPRSPGRRVTGKHSAGGAGANLSASRCPVEGYLQVVLTHPCYRRRGLASWLLRTCLANTEAPADAFATQKENREPYSIQQWHLHTLMERSLQSRKGKFLCVEGADSIKTGEEEEINRAAVVKATLSMYRQLGFVERRYLYKYYAGMWDAVELVKRCFEVSVDNKENSP